MKKILVRWNSVKEFKTFSQEFTNQYKFKKI